MSLDTRSIPTTSPYVDSIEHPFEARDLAGIELHGIAASSGRYAGRVCVINDESEIHKLRAGDVLVCTSASQVWPGLFRHVGALVIDNGGLLASSLSIAREYGIPAVAGARLATQQLCDGQMVEVDGGQGLVRSRPTAPMRAALERALHHCALLKP